MMEAVWARFEFRFYGTVCLGVQGEHIRVKMPHMQTDTELASLGRLNWDPKTYPAMPAFKDEISELQ